MSKSLNASEMSQQLPGYFTVAEASSLTDDNSFTVTFAGMQEVGQGQNAEDKPVLSFAESKKQLVLNKGRCAQLTALFGDDPLVGKTIKLTVENINGREQIVVAAPE